MSPHRRRGVPDIQVPPQGRLQLDHSPDDEISIPRTLDLRRRSDRSLLRAYAARRPAVQTLIDRYLGAYMTYFPEPRWQIVRAMGTIVVEPRPNVQHAMDLAQLLRLTRMLKRLETQEGFGALLNGFRNPSQIESAWFEVEIAHWCLGRTVTKALVLSPPVEVRGRQKRPEFLWQTSLGDLYCECKRADLIESAAHGRLARLSDGLRVALDDHGPWPEGRRVDVWLAGSGLNGVASRIHAAVGSLAQIGDRSSRVVEFGEVRAQLSVRGAPYPWEGEVLTEGLLTTGMADEINQKDCDAVFSMPAQGYRTRAAKHLIDLARKQLPDGGSGAVFVRLGGIAAALSRVQSWLTQPEYARTPWIGLNSGALLEAAWREGQPFDRRLLDGPVADTDARAARDYTGPEYFRVDDPRAIEPSLPRDRQSSRSRRPRA
jgi:hypothetical protein